MCECGPALHTQVGPTGLMDFSYLNFSKQGRNDCGQRSVHKSWSVGGQAQARERKEGRKPSSSQSWLSHICHQKRDQRRTRQQHLDEYGFETDPALRQATIDGIKLVEQDRHTEVFVLAKVAQTLQAALLRPSRISILQGPVVAETKDKIYLDCREGASPRLKCKWCSWRAWL